VNIERIREGMGGGFTPFRLGLSDGTKIPVPHPEFVALGRNVVLAVGENDRAFTLDPVHIVALEDLWPKAGSH
jgi:hypothetical protein